MSMGDELFNPEFEECIKTFRFAKTEQLEEERKLQEQ